MLNNLYNVNNIIIIIIIILIMPISSQLLKEILASLQGKTPEAVFFQTMFGLTGWSYQPTPPQQLGQDFRPSHREDGGSCESGGITFARIRRKISHKIRAAWVVLTRTPAESCIGGKGGNQRRTEEDAP